MKESNKKKEEDLLEYIRKREKDGYVVIMTFEGLQEGKLDDMILKQPVDGLLYDLNRSPEVIGSFLDGDNPKWINDWATMVAIKRLKEMLDEKTKK